MKKLFFYCLLCVISQSFSQQLAETTLVQNLPFKSIGPTIMSGRVSSLVVNPNNPNEFYVAYASGGVWHSNNNGTSFLPILDSSNTQNVGSIAVEWQSKTIWVGTGEVNSSRSSYAGIGILKSIDQGKTWINMGLKDAHHIGKIEINPNNSNEMVVAVAGHLYSTNQQRGVFKTKDGGKTWAKTLFVNDHTGIIDLSVNPQDYNLMFASSWDKDRKAWNFRGNGPSSAIYKSTDAGETWQKMSGKGSGFPTGDGLGRIGLAVFDAQTIYAIHDSQFRRKDEKSASKNQELQKEDFKTMSVSNFMNIEDKKLNDYLQSNRFPKKYTSKMVKKKVNEGAIKPEDLAKYLENANTLLFDTPVIGAEVYKSTDAGKTWNKTHLGYLDNLYYSYGYYFGKIHVSPQNKDHIYIYGVPILKSKDGGKIFQSISADNVHADHHDLWINPKNPNHLINGNDGGVNISFDDGENWIKCNTPSVGQFYTVNIDHEKPYNVYGGLQDNGVWVGPHTNKENTRWHQSGNYPYEFLMGGDGMQVEIDNRNSDIVYTGFQFGNYYRINRETDKQTYITPKHELGDSPYRFNWQSPILLSTHNQDILYLGGNKLMRSMNQGDDWEAISKDLTQGGKKGNVAYGTLTTINESPFQFGLLYTGSDDGLVHITKNGGGQWLVISETFPKDLWVSRVIASQHKKERVYVTLNGYRWDDFKAYVYVSENYGATWKNISSNLPISSVNVIKEDPENENLLYIGTDNGVYASFNKGENWEEFSKGIPHVAVHDLVIQPEANDLVLGTHGRSLYVANISILQKMTSENRKDIIISEIKPIHFSSRWGSKFSVWGEVYEPKITIPFYSPATSNVTISVKNKDGKELKSFSFDTVKGINVIEYDASLSEKGKKNLEKENTVIKEAENKKYYLPVGTYTLQINSETTNFEVN